MHLCFRFRLLGRTATSIEDQLSEKVESDKQKARAVFCRARLFSGTINAPLAKVVAVEANRRATVRRCPRVCLSRARVCDASSSFPASQPLFLLGVRSHLIPSLFPPGFEIPIDRFMRRVREDPRATFFIGKHCDPRTFRRARKQKRVMDDCDAG